MNIEDTLKESIANFFNLDFKELKEKSISKDLYSVVSEMTGISRKEVKLWIHGLTYGVGEIKDKPFNPVIPSGAVLA
jgi:hypothetical protein